MPTSHIIEYRSHTTSNPDLRTGRCSSDFSRARNPRPCRSSSTLEALGSIGDRTGGGPVDWSPMTPPRPSTEPSERGSPGTPIPTTTCAGRRAWQSNRSKTNHGRSGGSSRGTVVGRKPRRKGSALSRRQQGCCERCDGPSARGSDHEPDPVSPERTTGGAR